MREKGIIKRIFLFIVFIVYGISIIINMPHNLSYIDHNSYIILMIAYFIIGGLYVFTYFTRDIYIFEPIVLATFMYMGIFIIKPILDIINNNTLCFGKYIMGGCVKGTIIFIISYICFYLGYYLKDRGNIIPKKEINIQKKEYSGLIVKINLIIWSTSFIIFLFYLVKKYGLSIKYIFSLGLMNNDNVIEPSATPVDILGNLRGCLVTSWMYLYVYSKNKYIKMFTMIGTLIVFIINGSRFIIVIFLSAIVIYNYIKKLKRPSGFIVIITLCILLGMTSILGSIRNDMKSGNNFDLSNFNIEEFFYPFESNFTLYRPYYGMMETIPKEHPYQLGRQMFGYTLILVIPRALWKNKPEPPPKYIIKWIVNERAKESGLAYNNIGEYYIEFGILGCIIFMFLFGYICSWCKKLYLSKDRTYHNLIEYSLALPIIFSLINSGYTPNNFYMVLITFLPVIITKFYIKKKAVKGGRLSGR